MLAELPSGSRKRLLLGFADILQRPYSLPHHMVAIYHYLCVREASLSCIFEVRVHIYNYILNPLSTLKFAEIAY